LRQIAPRGQFVPLSDRHQKKIVPTACAGDPFLSWSPNRTVVLTNLERRG
jgi:hypothetical protein